MASQDLNHISFLIVDTILVSRKNEIIVNNILLILQIHHLKLYSIALHDLAQILIVENMYTSSFLLFLRVYKVYL